MVASLLIQLVWGKHFEVLDTEVKFEVVSKIRSLKK